MPPTKTWKNVERKAAAKFGARRNVLSGSSGRDDRSRSDSTHPTLFLECKYRANHAARALWEKTKVLAAREGKTPVLALAEKGKHGLLYVVHEDDLGPVLAALLAAQDEARRMEAAFDHTED